MEQMDLYLIGKHNIMQSVLRFYHFEVKEEQPLVLDCGCGIGTFAYKLNKSLYIGLDVNPASVKLAHKFHPDGTFVVGDAARLPFKNGIFDCAICSEVLEHISDDKSVLSELARVTKASGKWNISVPNKKCRNIFVNLQRSIIDDAVGHVRTGYSVSEISELVIDYGFKMQKFRYNCGPVTAIVEYCIIKLGRLFGYKSSSLDQLCEANNVSCFKKAALAAYKLCFPLIILLTYLDKLLPQDSRSNIAIIAEKRHVPDNVKSEKQNTVNQKLATPI